MTDTNIQPESRERTRYFIKEPLKSGILLRRLPVAILLVYYAWILLSAWSMSYSWSWSLDEGLTWPSGGGGSFIPIPSRPSNLGAPMVTLASMTDQIFYLIFMHSGIWIVWITLGVLYLFSPYRLEKTKVCLLLKGLIIVEAVLFLLGGILITNMHPYWMQTSVFGIGCLLLITGIVWIIMCKKQVRKLENGAEGEI